MNKISVVTINFNNKNGLKRTIESVLSQKEVEFEYIIIDGGSTDGSLDLINEHSSKISYWESAPDGGIYNAMNKGILVSNGAFINFINSGDVINGEYSLGVAQGVISRIALKGDTRFLVVLDCLIVGKHSIDLARGNVLKNKSDALASFLPHPSTFYSRKSFGDMNFFDEKNKIVSDFAWYMKAIFADGYHIKYYPYAYSVFFLDGISSLNSQRHVEEYKKVINEFFLPYQTKLFTSRKYKYLMRFGLFRKISCLFGIDSKVAILNIKE